MLLSMLVLSGWLMPNAFMLRVFPAVLGMGLPNALAFLLLGLALMPFGSGRWGHQALQVAAGCALVGIGTASLVVRGAPDGMLSPAGMAWLEAFLFLGRSAHDAYAATPSLAFIAAGFALILLPSARRKLAGSLIPLWAFFIFVAGLIGLAGIPLDLDHFYPRFQGPDMPLLSAAALIAASISIWQAWRRADAFWSRSRLEEDEKVSLIGGAVLMLVALTAGIAISSTQYRTLEATLSETLQGALNRRINLFRHFLEQRHADALSIAVRHVTVDAASALAAAPTDAAAREGWRMAAEASLSTSITGISLMDLNGNVLARAGSFHDDGQVDADLSPAMPARLQWHEDSMYLQSRVAVTAEGRTIAALLVQQRLPVITRELLSPPSGATGEMGLCTRGSGQNICFPQARNPRPYITSQVDHSGNPLAMTLALDGRAGIYRGQDYRGHEVISAYGTFPGMKLGMVVKQDADELYQPIRAQLEQTFPLLLAIVLVGACLLRASLKPLAARLLQSERQARDKEMRIRSVVDNVGEGIITFGHDGRIESFNHAAASIFGYASAEAIGMPIDRLLPEHARRLSRIEIRRHVRNGQGKVIGRRNVEMFGLRRDGAAFAMELTVTASQNDGAALLVAIVRDITERLRTREALRQANVDLEQRVEQRTAELKAANQLLTQEIVQRGQVEQTLRESEEQLRGIAAYQSRLKEEERKRIAREIHDELGGLLTGIKSYLSYAIDAIENGGAVGGEHLQQTANLADSAIDTVRRVITDLRPSVLDHLGLWPALEWHVDQVRKRSGLACSMDIDALAEATSLDAERSTAVFRIIQESLTNVVRHAQASAVTIRAVREEDSVLIELEDNGRGVEPGSYLNSRSWGIVGMHERARYLGGELSIAGVAGQGTVVTLRMPIEVVDVS
ncbi:PAS domain S-box-containing protein [Noviherbaspirillum humi]|uniref:PAS domain S-box-containing protein n=1 Tax=Noviherbaspirillum humi TaxID=1688639 RepID=A0A239GUU5_9BURK|nr:PAS domain S-box protein [Noviherbaspirillum humi]SNS72900.1 PAS domain S-box-containing protein [Noviherbaspirillum humi]